MAGEGNAVELVAALSETVDARELCGVNRHPATEDGDAAAASARGDRGLIAVSEIGARRADPDGWWCFTKFHTGSNVTDGRGLASARREEDVRRVGGDRLAARIERTAEVYPDAGRSAVTGDRKIAGL